MKEKLEARVNELKAELETGRKIMDEIEMKRANLGQTIIRISGAIQVLEELMSSDSEKDEA
ncbi:MAG: hypothetical protein Q8942_13435 [Bacillota bacterium]|nr:hypothetical protein [Bacillota bacterium]